MSLERLAILERLRLTAAEKDAERCPSRNGGLMTPSRVGIKDGASSTDILSSGPGSPIRREWKAFSSAIDEEKKEKASVGKRVSRLMQFWKAPKTS